MIISLMLIATSSYLAGRGVATGVDMLLAEVEEVRRRSEHMTKDNAHTFVAHTQCEYRAIKALHATVMELTNSIIAAGEVSEGQREGLASVVLDGVVSWACDGTSVAWGLAQRDSIPPSVITALGEAWSVLDEESKHQAFQGARLRSETALQ